MSKGLIVIDQVHKVGDCCVIESMSPQTDFAVLFEDDGVTAHFHGLDTRQEHMRLDLLHIYDVKAVEDAHEPIEIQVVWSEDGLKSALIINGLGHGVFDFEAQRAYCRNNKPQPNQQWTQFDHAWDENVSELFEP